MSQNVDTVFKHNGNEYEFDVRDVEFAERMENAVENLRKAEQKLPKTGSSSEIIKAHCKMIKAFFDECLGEGAGTAICTDRSNLSLCYAAYDLFLKFARAQKDDIIASKNLFAATGNRQQRRASAKNKSSNLKSVK